MHVYGSSGVELVLTLLLLPLVGVMDLQVYTAYV